MQGLLAPVRPTPRWGERPVTPPVLDPRRGGPVPPVAVGDVDTAVERFLDDLTSGPRGLSIRGAAGSGRTTVWSAAADRATAAGHLVLRARPAREDRLLTRSGLADLLDGAEVLTEVLDPDCDALRLGRTLLDHLRGLAAERPVVVAVDDVSWLDPLSLRALRYAVRRLGDDDPVGFLGTVRSDVRPTPTAFEDPTRAATVDLLPLDLPTLRQVLAPVVRAISAPTLRAIHRATGGNPGAAINLALALAAGAPETITSGTGDDATGERLDRLPPATTAVVAAVAVAGAALPDDLRAIAPATEAGLDRAIADGIAAGVLVVRHDQRVDVTDPLLASAAYGRLPPLARRGLHDRSAVRARHPLVRARHVALATGEPDPDVAATLEEAATDAAAAGDPDLAADLARHSVRLTPVTDHDAVHRRILAEVAHRAVAGDTAAAVARLDALLAASASPRRRVEVLLHRCAVVREAPVDGDPGGSEDTASEAALIDALEAAGDDPALRARVLDSLGWQRGLFRGDLRTGLRDLGDAAVVAAASGDRALWVGVEAHRLHAAVMAAETVPVPPLPEASDPCAVAGGGPEAWRAKHLLWTGDLDGARALLDRQLRRIGQAGCEQERPYRLYDRILCDVAAGDLATAEDRSLTAVRAARDADSADALGWLTYPRGLVHAWCGRRDEALDAADRLAGGTARPRGLPAVARGHHLRALVALGAGDPASAADAALAATGTLARWGVRHPGVLPAAGLAVTALAALGDLERLTTVGDGLRDACRWLATPWADAIVTRLDGDRAQALGDHDAAAVAFDAAAVGFSTTGHLLDAARARLAAGVALLRSGRRTRAAEALAEAHGALSAAGAADWVDQAAAWLERAQPGRSDGDLTTMERRIAAHVAEGARNREIATSLYVSVATVEAHLTRTYRKLGIRNRSELARLVVDGSVAV